MVVIVNNLKDVSYLRRYSGDNYNIDSKIIISFGMADGMALKHNVPEFSTAARIETISNFEKGINIDTADGKTGIIKNIIHRY